MQMETGRCPWCGDNPDYVFYHDEEWGVPVHDDQRLLETLLLSGAQAGLNWLTILRKRDGYRAAFHGFDVDRIAAYGPDDVERLMATPGIIRNRQKIESAIRNARGVRTLRAQYGTFGAFIWQFVKGATIRNRWHTVAEVPSRSAESERMSKALRDYGFSFVGPTICYAFMQAVGMVDDHLVSCFRHGDYSSVSTRNETPSLVR